MNSIVNIAAYKFVTLYRLEGRREFLRETCLRLDLKGTILLSEEGINLFLAGTRRAIDAFLELLRAEPEFEDLEVKESLSDRRPFNRMLVRLKKEIIAFGVDGVDPRAKTSRRVAARDLKRWLDEGRPVTLLDTRNDYEVEVGTFSGAVPIGLDEFRRFPEAVEALPEEMKERPVVTFCTGGIRCEKAAPYLERVGFRDVYQLDGGILKYFEECGGERYEGDCFVFDQRVALDPNLNETDAVNCFACRATLSKEERASPKYVPGRSCPRCHVDADTAMAKLLVRRNRAVAESANPLPGSIPYENRRPMRVPQKFDGARLMDFLDGLRTVHSRERWLADCDSNRVLLDDSPLAPDAVVRAGQVLIHVSPQTVEPDVNPAARILYEDDAVVAVNKPAPLPMHPCGRFNRNTLQYILHEAFAPLRLRPAHRLDANTSGVVVWSKSRAVARELQPQFENRRVAKSYLARIHGHPEEDSFPCDAPIGRGPEETGARAVEAGGLASRTEFTVRDRYDDGTSLVEALPLTGRTNQIRVHLWHLGMPICGDPLYLQDAKMGETQTLAPEDPPLCLHASRVEFDHPVSGKRMTVEAPAPEWVRRVLRSVRIAQ